MNRLLDLRAFLLFPFQLCFMHMCNMLNVAIGGQRFFIFRRSCNWFLAWSPTILANVSVVFLGPVKQILQMGHTCLLPLLFKFIHNHSTIQHYITYAVEKLLLNKVKSKWLCCAYRMHNSCTEFALPSMWSCVVCLSIFLAVWKVIWPCLSVIFLSHFFVGFW